MVVRLSLGSLLLLLGYYFPLSVRCRPRSMFVVSLSLSPLLSASLARERVIFTLSFPDNCPATLTNYMLPYLMSYPPPLTMFLLQLPCSMAFHFPRKTERRDKRREKRGEKSEYKREESVTQQIQFGNNVSHHTSQQHHRTIPAHTYINRYRCCMQFSE